VKRIKLSAAVFAAVMLAVPVGALAYKAATGISGQLNYSGCYSEPAADGCSAARDMNEPVNVALQDDESRVFVASHSSDAIAVFNRDRKTGLLTQYPGPRGCLSQTGDGGTCSDGRALTGVTDVVSHDEFIFWTADTANAVGAASKNASSRVFEMSDNGNACISEDGSSGCLDGHGLTAPTSIETGPGGSTLYVGADSSVAFLTRSKGSSGLNQSSGGSGCINDDGSDGCTDGYVPGPVTDLLLSNDGRFVYAAASGGLLDDGAVLVFARDASGKLTEVDCINNTGSNGCVAGFEIQNPMSLSADHSSQNSNLYVAANGSNAVDVLTRNFKTGALGEIQCWNELGLGGCEDGYDLTSPKRVQLYKTNKFVYVAAGDNVSSFSRDKHTGLLTQLPMPAACTSETGDGGNCIDGNGLTGATGLTSSGGGKNVYATSPSGDAVSVMRLGGH